MKILILKPSSLGDVVQALPVLRLLKCHLPEAEIYWWIGANLEPLLAEDPDLAGVIKFSRDRWAAPKHWYEISTAIQRLRRTEFDWVIDLQSLFRSGVFAWLANGKLTVGLDSQREGSQMFYDYLVRRPSYETHAVDWYLEVLRFLGVPVDHQFEWMPARPKVAEALAEKWPDFKSRWLILQPGARWRTKRWPVEHFSELASRCIRKAPDLRIAVLGGPEERELGEKICHSAPEHCLDLTGKLSLPEMVEWIRASELMVTNDTGPMHVAAAVGTPVLALFGPTEPRRTGPYGQLDRVLQLKTPPCIPCLKPRCRWSNPHECLRALSPDMVFDAIQLATARRVPKVVE